MSAGASSRCVAYCEFERRFEVHFHHSAPVKTRKRSGRILSLQHRLHADQPTSRPADRRIALSEWTRTFRETYAHQPQSLAGQYTAAPFGWPFVKNDTPR